MGDLLTWAADRPLFTVDDAQRAFGFDRPSLREKLSRLARRGDLSRIERGKYTVHDDPVVYATYIETPSYISLWSGLRYYDLTTQLPTAVQVITAEHRADLDSIRFYTTSDPFGFGKARYDGFEVFVADVERLLLDCLSRREVPVDALDELLAVVDPERAATYAQRYGRKAVMKRIGYLLERERGVLIEELRIGDRNYPVLDLARPDEGPTDARWRLRVNVDVE